MNQPNSTTDVASERRGEELLRQAESQGVRPLKFDELLGPPADRDSKQEVDDFLALRRRWREEERFGSRQ